MNPLTDQGDGDGSSQHRLNALVSRIPLFVVKLVGLIDKQGNGTESDARFNLLPGFVVETELVERMLCGFAQGVDRCVGFAVRRRGAGDPRQSGLHVFKAAKSGDELTEFIERRGIIADRRSCQVAMQVEVSRPVESNLVDEVPRRRNRVVAQPLGSGTNRSG